MCFVIREPILITGGTYMTLQHIRNLLDNSITNLKNELDLYTYNPEHSFSRNRKLPFEKVISTLLAMGGKSINNELLYQSGCSVKTASSSAFIQQRNKIKYIAFESLFYNFTKASLENNFKLYKGYRLLAVDGSDIQIALNHKDMDCFVQTRKDRKPYNLIHLNAMYDVLSNVYVDVLIQKYKQANERKALTNMVDRSDISKPTIIMADRGYESYNVLVHIQQKQWEFLIRIKDFGTHNSGILHGFDLPNEDEFDVDMDINLTRKQTNEVKELLKDRNHYKRLKSYRDFDYLPAKSKKDEPVSLYNLKFRIVRFKLTESSYEVIITNLDKHSFPPQIIKQLYGKRWGIETSFRDLKYTIGLLHFHSKKVELIYQEIYSRVIMYNFSEFIVKTIVFHNIKRKYCYTLNFSNATHICREFFLKRVSPPNVEALIQGIWYQSDQTAQDQEKCLLRHR